MIISLPLDVLGEVEGLGAGDVTDDDAAANRGGNEFVLIFMRMFFLPADGKQVGVDLAVDVKAEIFLAFFDDRFEAVQEPVICRFGMTFELGMCAQGCFIRFEFEAAAQRVPYAQGGGIIGHVEDEVVHSARCAVVGGCRTRQFWNFVNSVKTEFTLILNDGRHAMFVDVILHVGFVRLQDPCRNIVNLGGGDEEVECFVGSGVGEYDDLLSMRSITTKKRTRIFSASSF